MQKDPSGYLKFNGLLTASSPHPPHTYMHVPLLFL